LGSDRSEKLSNILCGAGPGGPDGEGTGGDDGNEGDGNGDEDENGGVVEAVGVGPELVEGEGGGRDDIDNIKSAESHFTQGTPGVVI